MQDKSGSRLLRKFQRSEKLPAPNANRKWNTLKIGTRTPQTTTVTRLGDKWKTSPFYDEIDSVLGCCDTVTFSHIKESAPGSSWSFSNSNGKEGGPEDEGSVDDEQFKEPLTTFGLKRKNERKSQRDERKRIKVQKCKSSMERTRGRWCSFPLEYEEVTGAGRQNFWGARVYGKKIKRSSSRSWINLWKILRGQCNHRKTSTDSERWSLQCNNCCKALFCLNLKNYILLSDSKCDWNDKSYSF